jgi:hypothetical protein
MTKHVFFSENESVMHLFFCCCVAHNMWNVISEIVDLPTITDFESLGRIWLRGRKAYNVLTTDVVWSIWKTRNNLCFQGACWSRMEVMFYLCAKLIMRWEILCKQEDSEKLEVWASELERSTRPPRVAWVPVSESSTSDINAQRSSAQSGGEDERGVKSDQSLSVVLLSEQTIDGRNVPDVRASTVNFASE